MPNVFMISLPEVAARHSLFATPWRSGIHLSTGLRQARLQWTREAVDLGFQGAPDLARLPVPEPRGNYACHRVAEALVLSVGDRRHGMLAHNERVSGHGAERLESASVQDELDVLGEAHHQLGDRRIHSGPGEPLRLTAQAVIKPD